MEQQSTSGWVRITRLVNLLMISWCYRAGWLCPCVAKLPASHICRASKAVFFRERSFLVCSSKWKSPASRLTLAGYISYCSYCQFALSGKHENTRTALSFFSYCSSETCGEWTELAFQTRSAPQCVKTCCVAAVTVTFIVHKFLSSYIWTRNWT